ncbi:MAG TPA: beta-ketoacyl synthase N-terminal-like domain-containing protein, partial [Gemmatimonadales bacterium]|nr:beta-ketoacyl synthase N-terminal-like domain-containing protein [Gemmatimonadales bacterium]
MITARLPARPPARRVVITGIGAFTPIGAGVEGLWSGLRECRSAVRTVTRFDPSPFRTRVAAEIDDFRPRDFMNDKEAKRLDRFTQLSLAGARLAIEDSG